MKVRFLDLGEQFKEVEKAVTTRMKALFKRSDFILGEDVRKFERSFAEYTGSKYALGVNSGTDALFLGLLALGVGPGDEVIVPVYTYIASAFAVTYTGARPVFVDIEASSYNIDASRIGGVVTPRTKAIMPVHLYGQAADMTAILKISREHGLKVIEDAAQAHGATFEGKKAGSLGDVGAFSFYPTKNLGALGDAGMIMTDNGDIFERLKKLRDYGRKTRYEHGSLGYNSRLDSIQAVFLNEKLKKLDTWNKKRIKAAKLYRRLLKGVDGILLPRESGFGLHNYHIFAIRLKNRDAVAQGLKKCGIDVMVHYPVPLHLQEVYRGLGYKEGDFPVAEKVADEILCLPIYPHIKEKQVKYVACKLKESIKNG